MLVLLLAYWSYFDECLIICIWVVALNTAGAAQRLSPSQNPMNLAWANGWDLVAEEAAQKAAQEVAIKTAKAAALALATAAAADAAIRKMYDDCNKEWLQAREDCIKNLALPNPDPSYTSGGPTMYDCMRGRVSEDCGGNAVTYPNNKF